MATSDQAREQFKYRNTAQTVSVTFQPHDRAVLAVLGEDGHIHTQPVEVGASVLNIKHDLIAHMNANPMPTEWLEEVCAYLINRIEARKAAKAGGYLIQPSQDGRTFERVAFRPVRIDDARVDCVDEGAAAGKGDVE